MKKTLSIILIASILFSIGFSAKGGVVPCLATCFLGPRVGVEMNEGSKIRQMEWIAFIGGIVFGPLRLIGVIDPTTGKSMNQISAQERLGVPPIYAKAPAQKGGFVTFLASCCIGPRVGLEMNDGRKVRNMELLALVPIVQIVPVVLMAYEAYEGKTMTQIAAAEKLDR